MDAHREHRDDRLFLLAQRLFVELDHFFGNQAAAVNILGYTWALAVGKRVPAAKYDLLYHGTDEHPVSWVRGIGLPAKGTDLELWHHAEPPPRATAQSAFRGATLHLVSYLLDSGAVLWGQWIYEISDFPGYDLAKLLDGRIPCPTGFRGLLMRGEQEIAIPAEVPLKHIARAGEVKLNTRGRPVVEWARPWP